MVSFSWMCFFLLNDPLRLSVHMCFILLLYSMRSANILQIWPPKSVKDSGSRLHSKLKEAIMQVVNFELFCYI